MKRKNITLGHPERFATIPVIPKEKLDKAIAQACDRLEKMGQKHGLDFPGNWSVNFQYEHKNTNIHKIHLYEVTKVVKFTEAESRMMVAWA